MEKVFEEPLLKPLPLVEANMEKRLCLLRRRYKKQVGGYGVAYAWDKTASTLRLQSDQYDVQGEIKFTSKKIIGYLRVPFWLKPLAGIWHDQIVREIKGEVHEFLETL